MVIFFANEANLGGDASVLQQHSRPDGGVTCYKPPVTTHLSHPQQGFGVQVCEDAEKRRPHFQHLGADHLAGLGWALLVTAGLVATVRTSWKKKKRKRNKKGANADMIMI